LTRAAKDMPDATVVIPTRNRWRLLSTRALPSALAQEGVALEVVVVDDASNDATASQLERLEDARVRTVRHDERGGLAEARNTGIAAARSDWVAFLDDDDLWAPDKLRRQLELARATGATFVYSPALYVDDDRRSVEFAPAPDPKRLTPALLAGKAIPAGGSNVLVKTEPLREVGGFDPKIFHVGDFDCWLRLDRVCSAAACEEPLLAYMQHRENMHLRSASRLLADARRMRAKYRSEYEDLGRAFDTEGFLLWIADQHRKAGRPVRAARTYFIAGVRHANPRYLARAALLLTGSRGMAVGRAVLSAARPVTRRPPAQSHDKPALSDEPVPDWLAPHLTT
jgi:glycosyltransferase involved in cell wall biosynthesis